MSSPSSEPWLLHDRIGVGRYPLSPERSLRRLRGAASDVTIGYDPDDMKTIHAHVVEHDPPKFIPLDGLITERLADTHPPRRQPLDREAVEANIRWWADGLRQIASDVL